MARTNSVNFTGALQYPMATAAADIFKKEDVQVLAQAVDQHNHGTGKGLPLDPASIPNGFITSAMIADGTIATGDIAAGAITQQIGDWPLGTFSGVSASTTSSSVVNIAPAVQVTITTVANSNVLVLAYLVVTLTNASAIGALGVRNDGAGPGLITHFQPISAAPVVPVTLLGIFGPPGAGTHTYALCWGVSAGTMSVDSSSSALIYAVEFKK